MNGIDFFSNNTYIFLPTLKNPRVALAIDDKDIANNSFELSSIWYLRVFGIDLKYGSQ